uniref:Phosphodiesterase n=1 Tax=Neospora caninum (strain Liverpool) TaxID=572307 RepID=A0A0F7UIC9_NEOCL|nr:TPA: high-affinity cGMP-specific 3',5'-cyclic phosphodiesterase 9A, putative [Neospora caninum Liverpool]
MFLFGLHPFSLSAALERSDVNTENEARLLQIANPELSNLFPQRDVIPVCLYPDVNRVISAIDAVGVSTSVDDISGAIAEESQPEGLVRARCFVDEYDVSLALARYYQGLPETGPPEEPPPPATFMRKADGSGEQSEADTGRDPRAVMRGLSCLEIKLPLEHEIQAYFNLVSKAAREGEPLTMHRLLDWDFHVLTLPPASAVLVTRDLLTQFALKANMDIPGEIIMAFSVAIFKNYRPNPYHNFYHALNVAQVLCLLLALPDVAVQFTPIDYLVLSVAALGHDLGHPGANNLFMTRFDCWPSRIYQNVSVLENYHAASLFQILRHPGFNVFCSVSATNFAPIRKRIISAILWTDMAKHFDVVAKLQAKIQGEMVLTEGIIVTLTKPYLEGLLLHAADISNPMMDFELCRDWAFRACDEFYQQNKMEEMGGFPPSMPNFQHFDEYNVAKCQVGFIDAICKPLFNSLALMFPAQLGDRATQLQKNSTPNSPRGVATHWLNHACSRVRLLKCILHFTRRRLPCLSAGYKGEVGTDYRQGPSRATGQSKYATRADCCANSVTGLVDPVFVNCLVKPSATAVDFRTRIANTSAV